MRGLVVLFILVLSVAGCGGKSERSGTSRSKSGDTTGSVSQRPSGVDWTPENVDIKCAPGENCPGQVGLVIFVEPVKWVEKAREWRHPTHKCTGFLSAPNQVTTNGHCDYFAISKGYFVTALTSPVGRQVRRITSLAFKVFTPHPKGSEFDSGRPDVTIYNLDSPINLPGLQFAGLRDAKYSQLIGFVLDPAPEDSFLIKRITCTARRHEAAFPYNFEENPDVLTVYGCFARRGNSGGPMFAPGSSKVQAVVQGGGDPGKLAEVAQAEQQRELYVYEKHWTVTASNVRCLNVPRGTCLNATREESAARFTAHVNRLHQLNPSRPLQFNEWAEVPGQQ